MSNVSIPCCNLSSYSSIKMTVTFLMKTEIEKGIKLLPFQKSVVDTLYFPFSSDQQWNISFLGLPLVTRFGIIAMFIHLQVLKVSLISNNQ